MTVWLVRSPQRQESVGGKSKTGLTVDPFDIQVDILLYLPLGLLFALPLKIEKKREKKEAFQVVTETKDTGVRN